MKEKKLNTWLFIGSVLATICCFIVAHSCPSLKDDISILAGIFTGFLSAVALTLLYQKREKDELDEKFKPLHGTYYKEDSKGEIQKFEGKPLKVTMKYIGNATFEIEEEYKWPEGIAIAYSFVEFEKNNSSLGKGVYQYKGKINYGVLQLLVDRNTPNKLIVLMESLVVDVNKKETPYKGHVIWRKIDNL